jgi:hypothetical protein
MQPLVKETRPSITKSIIFCTYADAFDAIQSLQVYIPVAFPTSDSLTEPTPSLKKPPAGVRIGLAHETDRILTSTAFPASYDTHLYPYVATQDSTFPVNWDPLGQGATTKKNIRAIELIASATVANSESKLENEDGPTSVQCWVLHLTDVVVWQTPYLIPDVRCQDREWWDIEHVAVEDCNILSDSSE